MDLKRCPHCRGRAQMQAHRNVRGLGVYGATGYRVECLGECHSMTCYYHEEEDAAHAWNERLYFKDHEIREFVNELRDAAIKYKDCQQLRDRLAAIVRSMLTDSN